MHARVTWLEGSPAQAGEAIRGVREKVLPAIRDVAGFAGLWLLLDRDAGRAMTLTLWETREDMDASEEAALRLRNLPIARWRAQGTERYEVTLRVGPTS